MAIAVDASTPALATGTPTATTAAFTAPANSVLVALCAFGGGAGANAVTNSGTALTWTRHINHQAGEDSGAYAGTAAIYTAVTTSAVSRTVSATSGAGAFIALKVLVFTGANTLSPVGATGEGSATTQNLTPTVYTSTEKDSRAVGIGTDSSHNSDPTSSDVGFPYRDFSTHSGIAVYKAADTATASSAVTLNFNGTGGARTWNWAAVEIRPGALPQTVTASGIASGEAFGTAKLNFTVIGSGIASGEAFGVTGVFTPNIQTITPSGIASGEAFGALTTKLYLGPSGIASGEAFGTARLSAVIGPFGIASGEAFGLTNVAIEQFISPSGIASGEALGTPALQLGYPQTIEVEGIESAEVVEDPSISLLHRLMLTNPSIQETPAAWHRLFARYGLHRGITIMKDASGVWSSVRYPSQTEIEEALTVYMGGHRHTLTTTEADELTAAGYAANISLEDA